MAEAVAVDSPAAMRQLFAFICVFNSSKDALSLWEKFKDDMTEDFRRLHTDRMSDLLALQDLQKTLLCHGLKCQDFSLPDPGRLPDEVEFHADQEEIQGKERIENLNVVQKKVFIFLCFE